MTPIMEKENETCKLYVRGYDNEGRALLYMRPAKENTQDAVNNMRHLTWNLEKAIACSAKNGRSKVCIIIDYDEFSLRHAPPLSTSRYTLDILQKHYPERMHKAYICNPPFVFRYVIRNDALLQGTTAPGFFVFVWFFVSRLLYFLSLPQYVLVTYSTIH